MKERPILFNDAMVRAILDCRKTQTRRVVKPQPVVDGRVFKWAGPRPKARKNTGATFINDPSAQHKDPLIAHSCPYGQPGDRLWVREGARVIAKRHREIGIVYRADGEARTVPYPSRLAPAPLGKCLANGTYREASRITLEVTGVRVERLNEISETDAVAEGVMQWMLGPTSPRDDFRGLWESINGPGSWDANPWVWVVEFKRVES
jgi:hypothetical protein